MSFMDEFSRYIFSKIECDEMMTFNVLQNLASLAIFSVLYLCSQIGSDQRTQYTRAGTVGNNVLGGRGAYTCFMV